MTQRSSIKRRRRVLNRNGSIFVVFLKTIFEKNLRFGEGSFSTIFWNFGVVILSCERTFPRLIGRFRIFSNFYWSRRSRIEENISRFQIPNPHHVLLLFCWYHNGIVVLFQSTAILQSPTTHIAFDETIHYCNHHHHSKNGVHQIDYHWHRLRHGLTLVLRRQAAVGTGTRPIVGCRGRSLETLPAEFRIAQRQRRQQDANVPRKIRRRTHPIDDSLHGHRRWGSRNQV